MREAGTNSKTWLLLKLHIWLLSELPKLRSHTQDSTATIQDLEQIIQAPHAYSSRSHSHSTPLLHSPVYTLLTPIPAYSWQSTIPIRASFLFLSLPPPIWLSYRSFFSLLCFTLILPCKSLFFSLLPLVSLPSLFFSLLVPCPFAHANYS